MFRLICGFHFIDFFIQSNLTIEFFKLIVSVVQASFETKSILVFIYNNYYFVYISRLNLPKKLFNFCWSALQSSKYTGPSFQIKSKPPTRFSLPVNLFVIDFVLVKFKWLFLGVKILLIFHVHYGECIV